MDSVYNRVLLSDKHNKERSIITDEEQYKKECEIRNKKGEFWEIVGLPEYKVKPYFDLDGNGEIDMKMFDEFETDLKNIYDAPIAKSGRGTRIKNGNLRHSKRYYLLNTKISYELIPEFFKDLFNKYGKKGYNILDESVYQKNRKMYIPLSSVKVEGKGKKFTCIDVPKLEIIEGSIFDNCATYIEENYVDLDGILCDRINKILKELKEHKEAPKYIKEQKIEYEDEDDEDDGEMDVNVYTKLSKILERLSSKRADDYNDWLNVVFCIMNISQKEKIPKRKMYELIHQFSKKSSKYNETEVDDKIDINLNNNTDKKLGWNFLYNTCIKEDDENFYKQLNKNYKNVKKEFEEKHFKIIHPPMIITIDREGKNILQGINDAKKSFSHIDFNKKYVLKNGETKFKSTPLLNEWLNDPNMRLYDKVVFKPPSYIRKPAPFIDAYEEKPNIQLNNYEYNLWTHYEILETPYNNDKYYNSKILDDFYDYMYNLFGNDKEVINYLLAYFANKLQKPYERNKVCIILKGEEGDGKNTFFDIFKKIIGEKYYAEIESAKQLFGDHSLVENEKMIVCLNEANAQGTNNTENSDRLKARITTDTINVNPKGINQYVIDNRCDYLMTTNNDGCVKVDEGARRYVLIKSSTYYKGNVDFFEKFYKNIVDNKEALRVIYEYIINFDVASIVPSLNFQDVRYMPKTEYHKQEISKNKDRILLFIEDLTLKNLSGDKKKYSNQSFFNEWSEWVKQNNFKIDMNNISFGTRLMLLVKKEKLTDHITKDQNKNTIINFRGLMTHFDFKPEYD